MAFAFMRSGACVDGKTCFFTLFYRAAHTIRLDKQYPAQKPLEIPTLHGTRTLRESYGTLHLRKKPNTHTNTPQNTNTTNKTFSEKMQQHSISQMSDFDDLEEHKHMQTDIKIPRHKYEQIMEIVQKQKEITPDAIAKKVGINGKQMRQILALLEEKGVAINVREKNTTWPKLYIDILVHQMRRRPLTEPDELRRVIPRTANDVVQQIQKLRANGTIPLEDGSYVNANNGDANSIPVTRKRPETTKNQIKKPKSAPDSAPFDRFIDGVFIQQEPSKNAQSSSTSAPMKHDSSSQGNSAGKSTEDSTNKSAPSSSGSLDRLKRQILASHPRVVASSRTPNTASNAMGHQTALQFRQKALNKKAEAPAHGKGAVDRHSKKTATRKPKRISPFAMKMPPIERKA